MASADVAVPVQPGGGVGYAQPGYAQPSYAQPGYNAGYGGGMPAAGMVQPGSVVVPLVQHRGETGDFYRSLSLLTGVVSMLGSGFALWLATSTCNTSGSVNTNANSYKQCDILSGTAGSFLLALAFSLAVACLALPMLRSGSALDWILGLMIGAALCFIFIGMYGFARFMDWSFGGFPQNVATALYVLFGIIAFIAMCLWFGVLGSWKTGHGNFYAHDHPNHPHAYKDNKKVGGVAHH